MTGKDWLLLFIAQPTGESAEVAPMDPLRIMKGIFYFTRKFPGLYEFEPYHLGPICFNIYDDLRILVQEGMIATEDVPWQTWKTYYPTSKGVLRAAALQQTANANMVDELQARKNDVCSLNFLDLLRKVYSDYPEFASKSVFNFD
jgi:hypothetical protein